MKNYFKHKAQPGRTFSFCLDFGGRRQEGEKTTHFISIFYFLIAFSVADYPGDQQILALSKVGRRQSRGFLILHSSANPPTHKSKHHALRGANSNASAVKTEQKEKDNL